MLKNVILTIYDLFKRDSYLIEYADISKAIFFYLGGHKFFFFFKIFIFLKVYVSLSVLMK